MLNRTVITRIVLAILGCLPLFYFYVWLSIALFLGVLFAGIHFGPWLVLGALLWWGLGTIGLAVLFYSSVTFTPARDGLPTWQLAGLIGGIVAAIPIGFQFASSNGWDGLTAVFLACCSVAYIIFSAFGGNQRIPNKS